MTSICFYFQVHQPCRLQPYSYFDIGSSKGYFDESLNELVLKRVAERCYLPMNALLLEAIEETEGRFRCAFSLSGTVLEQLERWAPEVVESFRSLFETGAVELLCETSHHSHAALGDPEEFVLQVETQRETLLRLFDKRPTTFRNTELVIDEAIAKRVEDLGFTALLGEGADQLLGWRTPHVVYRPRGCSKLALLLRAYVYSDDIAFRFSNKEWPAYPLLADTFVEWLDEVPEEAPFIGLFMDYETFGEHQAKETGIFDFMRALPGFVLENPRFDFSTPDELARRHRPAAELAYPRSISWADAERDVSAWLGNHMQREAHKALYELSKAARSAESELYEAWRKLSTSDHTYYMSTPFAADSDGDVHEYFSPYDRPHDAFITYMNVVEDLASRITDPQS